MPRGTPSYTTGGMFMALVVALIDQGVAEPLMRRQSQKARFEIDAGGVQKHREPNVDTNKAAQAHVNSVDIRDLGAEQPSRQEKLTHGHGNAEHTRNWMRRENSPEKLVSTNARIQQEATTGLRQDPGMGVDMDQGAVGPDPYQAVPVAQTVPGAQAVPRAQAETLPISRGVSILTRWMMEPGALGGNNAAKTITWEKLALDVMAQRENVAAAINRAPDEMKLLNEIRQASNMEIAGINLLLLCLDKLAQDGQGEHDADVCAPARVEVALQNLLTGAKIQKVKRKQLSTDGKLSMDDFGVAKVEENDMRSKMHAWIKMTNECHEKSPQTCPGHAATIEEQEAIENGDRSSAQYLSDQDQAALNDVFAFDVDNGDGVVEGEAKENEEDPGSSQ